MQYAGRCNKVFNEHTDTIKALAVIGDGQLASGGDDACIKIWVCADVLLYCLVLCGWCHWNHGHAQFVTTHATASPWLFVFWVMLLLLCLYCRLLQ